MHDVYPRANEYRQTNKHLRARDYHVDHQDVRVLVGHNWTPRPNDCKSKGGNYSRWHNCSPSTGNLWNRGEKYLTRKCFCAKKIVTGLRASFERYASMDEHLGRALRGLLHILLWGVRRQGRHPRWEGERNKFFCHKWQSGWPGREERLKNKAWMIFL